MLTISKSEQSWMDSWAFQYNEMRAKGRTVVLTTHLVMKRDDEVCVARIMTDGYYVYVSMHGGGGFHQVFDGYNPAHAVTHTGTVEELEAKMRARYAAQGWSFE